MILDTAASWSQSESQPEHSLTVYRSLGSEIWSWFVIVSAMIDLRETILLLFVVFQISWSVSANFRGVRDSPACLADVFGAQSGRTGWMQVPMTLATDFVWIGNDFLGFSVARPATSDVIWPWFHVLSFSVLTQPHSLETRSCQFMSSPLFVACIRWSLDDIPRICYTGLRLNQISMYAASAAKWMRFYEFQTARRTCLSGLSKLLLLTTLLPPIPELMPMRLHLRLVPTWMS